MIFRSFDNTVLYCESVLQKKAWGSIFVVHGLGEHCGRYEEFAAECGRLGLNVFMIDLRGHGRSQGVRGHFESIAHLHEDLNCWMEHLTKAGVIDSDKPALLFGHSLGGLVAVTWLAQYVQKPLYPALDSLILSAPALGVHLSLVQSIESQLAKYVPGFFRAFQMPSGIAPESLSHDHKEVELYLDDPLVHGWITPAAHLAMMDAIATLPDLIPAVDVPTLFLIPGKDKVVDAAAAKKFADKLAIAHPGNVGIKLFHSFFHEPFHELKRERAYTELKKWILKLRSSNKSSLKSSAKKATARASLH